MISLSPGLPFGLPVIYVLYRCHSYSIFFIFETVDYSVCSFYFCTTFITSTYNSGLYEYGKEENLTDRIVNQNFAGIIYS